MDRVALLLWGDVIEDYLDRIGLTVESFLRDVSSGWMFGYIAGLRAHGIESALVLVSASVRRPHRTVHEPTGTVVWLLPPSAVFRTAQATLRRILGNGLLSRALRGAAREVVAYSSTPIVRLAQVSRRERVRAILCQEYESPRFDACVALGWVLRLPVFGIFQGGSRHHHRLERVVRPYTMRAAAGLVIGAAVEVARVTQVYGLDSASIGLIGNPVAIPGDLNDVSVRDRGRKELGVDAETVLVAWHGRVELERKGLDLLIDAWRRVLEHTTTTDVRLALMGTGGDADRLRDLLARSGSDVTWIDEYVTDRARIERFLAAADVYAFPSPHEGFPVAPLEAMAAGTAVVATAAPGVEEILDDGEASGGMVVPVGDVEAFARALVRLVDDVESRLELGRLARRRASETYAIGAVGSQLREFLQRRGTRFAGTTAGESS